MDPITRQGISVAGGAGGGEGLYVDDVFSTFLYTGNKPSSQTITNGIDLSGEGGMVWIKRRETAGNHVLYDTERGATKSLYPAETDAENTRTGGLTSFNSNGFSIGSNSYENYAGDSIVSWTFRKAPGFFDVVTYSGTGSAQNISHSLGSVPGMIIIHCRDGSHDWEVYHRSLGGNSSIKLNSYDTSRSDSTIWNNTNPTSSAFTVGTSSNVNQNGHEYVAYIFAHDEQSFGTDEDESIIKCGYYVGNGSNDGPEINLGFEPQFLLYKGSTQAANWEIIDVLRGMPRGTSMKVLRANTNAAEFTDFSTYPTSTGFKITNNGGSNNASGKAYIYMAIRRPHKPPTAGTEVFDIKARTSANPNLFSIALPYADAAWNKITNSTGSWMISSRLTDRKWMRFNETQAEQDANAGNLEWDYNYKVNPYFWSNNDSEVNYILKRAPGFFDVVAYTGTGSAQNINHNLESVPEMIICKARDVGYNWTIYNSSSGATKRLRFNNNPHSSQTSWNNTAPTSSVFTVGSDANTNNSSTNYIAYLFATLDGVSKIGSFSGTGSNINVDCGFTAGARFVLIKRTDNDGDWYVWDSARGIVSGNDPYLLMNSNAAEVTNTDYVDPLSSGFTVTSSAPAALNTSGGTYLFLAIA